MVDNIENTNTQTPTATSTISDDDTFSPTTTTTEDNLDGDVNITITVSNGEPVEGCKVCCCYPCCCNNAMMSQPCSQDVPRPAGGNVSVSVKKINQTFNFGAPVVPVGYFNTQGGGQGVSVLAPQQTLAPQQSGPYPGQHGAGCMCATCCPGVTDPAVNATTVNYTTNYNDTTTVDTDYQTDPVPVTATEGNVITSTAL